MEKTWEEFFATGKVTDYLAYRNEMEGNRNRPKEKEETEAYGTISCTDGNGAEFHAHWGI